MSGDSGVEILVIHSVHGAPMNETAVCTGCYREWGDEAYAMIDGAEDAPEDPEFTTAVEPWLNDTVCTRCGADGSP